MRNLKDVLTAMIDALPCIVQTPNNVEEVNLVANLYVKFEAVKKGLGYTPPENMHFWWEGIETALHLYFPSDYSELNSWQKKIVDIFTGKIEL